MPSIEESNEGWIGAMVIEQKVKDQPKTSINEALAVSGECKIEKSRGVVLHLIGPWVPRLPLLSTPPIGSPTAASPTYYS
jgi:hypothetical protein